MKNNYKKGFVYPAIIVIVILLIAGGVYWGMKDKNTTLAVPVITSISPFVVTGSNSTETRQLVKVDVSDWKTFTISDLGVEFKYPAYFGGVIIKKTDRASCPQTKTYQSPELLPSQDYVISFSNKPQVGTGKSYMEARINIASTENNTIYCGLDISVLGKKMDSNSNYQKLNSGRTNIKEEYMSNIFTTIGTSANQFYSFLFVKRNTMILVQPIITFIPYAGTIEEKEIAKDNDIVGFITSSKNAETARLYFRDFEALAASLKFTN